MRFTTRIMLLAAIATSVAAVGVGAASAWTGGLTVDPKATLLHDRTQVIASGTVACQEGDLVEVDANVGEVVGRIGRYARGFTNVECTGAEQPWSIVMTALTPNVHLLPGPANVYAQAFDLYDYSFTAMYGQVLLVR